MKHIPKSACPGALSRLQPALRGCNWEDFTSRHHDVYEACFNTALGDQANECAYTGLPIRPFSQGAHIDHFHRKGLTSYKALTFDWSNLFVALHEPRGVKYGFGADHKDRTVNSSNHSRIYSQLLNPAVDQPERFFRYSTDGSVMPRPSLSEADKERALVTIDTFNLNHSLLRNKRLEVMKMVEGMLQQGNPEEMVRLACSSVGFSFLIDFELSSPQ